MHCSWQSSSQGLNMGGLGRAPGVGVHNIHYLFPGVFPVTLVSSLP
jgi:hypothetical protein